MQPGQLKSSLQPRSLLTLAMSSLKQILQQQQSAPGKLKSLRPSLTRNVCYVLLDSAPLLLEVYWYMYQHAELHCTFVHHWLSLCFSSALRHAGRCSIFLPPFGCSASNRCLCELGMWCSASI